MIAKSRMWDDTAKGGLVEKTNDVFLGIAYILASREQVEVEEQRCGRCGHFPKEGVEWVAALTIGNEIDIGDFI